MARDTLDVDGLQELMWNFASHRVITVAGRTGILGRLAAGAAAPQEVASSLELDPLATAKVMRALTALGLLEAEKEAYRLVEPLVPHFQPGPNDLTPFLEHLHQMYERWGGNLESWVRGDKQKAPRRGPPDTKKFGAAMQAMGTHVAKMVAAALDLNGVSRMLDVGGGFGHYAKALCRVRPELTATVLDTPEVVALASEAIAGTELEDRITFIEGDYLATDLGEGYDLVLHANVLHQESQERAARLVRRGAQALKPGGRLAVVDFSIDERQHGQVLGALFAINMRSFGDTHTEASIRGWMAGAGLDDIERTDLNDHRWLIVGHKAGQEV